MAYAAASDVKTYLGISVSTDDTLITALITRAQAAIDRYCNRTFEASANSTRYFDAVADVYGPTLILDEDLASINSVTNGDGTTVTSSQYVTEPRNMTPYYALRIRSDASVAWTYSSYPENAIAISGKWAYSTSAPADIVHACIRLASYYYRQKDAQVFDVTATPELGQITIPQGLPRDVEILLEPYRKRGR